MAELAHAGEVAEVLGGDDDPLDLLLEDLAERLARQPRDLALERADARLARVIADQVAQAVLGQLELALSQSVRLDLLADQVPLGDLDLLVFGVTLQPDDLHAVEQRLRQVQRVGRAHEHHVAEVDVELEVMVLELRVLLRVEHLEQRRGRIAAEILAELVDLVEQEQRVARARLAQVGDDLARKRADVGAAVAADFGLVAHAAERLAHELAPGRAGDRLAEARLAHARRADEAQDRPLQLVGARLDREVLDDPVLDLVERVVILVEDFLRLGDVLLEAALLAPWQPEQHVEIVAHHGRLGAHRLHRLELLELRRRLGLGVLRQLERVDLLLQLGDLVAGFLVTAQLGLDRLELLVEVVLALRLLHLPLHAAADLALDLQDGELALHDRIDHLEALERIGFGEKRLLGRDLGRERTGDRVGEAARVVDSGQLFLEVLGQLLVVLGVVGELFDRRAHHRRDFVARDGILFDQLDIGGHVIAGIRQPEQPPARLAFDQHPHGAVG